MKTFVHGLIISVLLIAAGCSTGREEQKIIVQKRMEVGNQFEDFKEITDTAQVKKVKSTVVEAKWKEAHVEFVRPADYQFIFLFKDPQIEAKPVQYKMWVSPEKDVLEMTRGESEFTSLIREESVQLLEIISGETIIQ